jgi:MoaA/NifB/PqqE/SkfB family radical SAM enzyme
VCSSDLNDAGWRIEPPVSEPSAAIAMSAATDAAEVASKMITLIVPNGNVYPCNSTKKGPIGNVFDMTCDDRKSRSLDKHAEFCALNNRCSAFLTARAVESLPNPTEDG